MKWLVNFIFLFINTYAFAQYKIEVLDSNGFQPGEGVILSKISFRGLSVVNDQTIWVSGSRGTIARSIDGGKTFSIQQIKGYKKSDFRDIEAFDDKRAIIMSSGTPAYILKTIDGGQTWKEVYKNTDAAYFLDAMDFWNDKKGILVGDPVNAHFILLQTNDSGETWQQLDTNKTPEAMPGEAIFAASGTSLRCWGKDAFGFVTGGSQSRLIYSFEFGKLWFNRETKIIHSKSSQGAFSFSFDTTQFEIVGGDYLNDSLCEDVCSSILIGDSRFHFDTKTNGYRSCIENIRSCEFITCGPNGTDYLNAALNKSKWKSINKESFNVVRKAKKGKAVFLAGSKGKIGKLIY